MDTITGIWSALSQVRHLDFSAQSQSNTSWTGSGTGSVRVESPTPEILLFHDTGVWHSADCDGLEFRNIYRWSRLANTIRLEHLRFGEKHPVYLFALAAETDTTWVSVTPHVCREDEYIARLEIQDSHVSLNWRIIGPAKNEDIVYRYRYGS